MSTVEEDEAFDPLRDRSFTEWVAGAVSTLVALIVAYYLVLLTLFSHRILTAVCDRATRAATCSGPLLTGGYAFALLGVGAVLVGAIALQLRAFRRGDGLWAWPLVAMGAIAVVVLVGVLLMRTAHPVTL